MTEATATTTKARRVRIVGTHRHTDGITIRTITIDGRAMIEATTVAIEIVTVVAEGEGEEEDETVEIDSSSVLYLPVNACVSKFIIQNTKKMKF